jgi:hypothetical protein
MGMTRGLLHQHDKTHEKNIGKTCIMHWNDEKMHTIFLYGNPKRTNHLEQLGVLKDGRIIWKCIFKNEIGGLAWIHLAKGEVKYRALNVV